MGPHIANGGMAGVWAAEDQLLGRPVAIKVLAPHLAEEPVNAQRFQREARAAAQLSGHQNVVTVYDVGEHEGRAFIVMERAEGGTVADRLREGRPSREQALQWLRETAAALDHAHDVGIVHRDVKPANLLLDAHDHVRVADFGIARIATEDTMTLTGQLLGTAAYLSPEQVEGHGATPASDLYSLAVVAFELLTGERPFGGDHIAAQARQHVEAPPPRASERADLPVGVDVVLQRGMAKDPEARWPSATAFVDALAGALAPKEGRRGRTTRTVPLGGRRAASAGAAEAAPPPATPRRPREPAGGEGGGSRRAKLLIAVVALLLVGAGVAWAVSQGGSSSDTGAKSQASTNHKTQKKSAPKQQASTPSTSTPSSSSSTPTQSTPSQTSSSSGSGSSSGSSDAASLQSQGHSLVTQGKASEAIPVLQRALKATGRSTDECIHPTGSCLTYAYALFDLGVAYDATKNPNAAIPILEQRLRIDNQRPAVEAELAKARQVAGGGSSSSPSGKVPPGQAKKDDGKPGHGG
ncbi:MAG TPA: serine/threonine-protein kinase [Solirubrobacteraceae bacterium]